MSDAETPETAPPAAEPPKAMGRGARIVTIVSACVVAGVGILQFAGVFANMGQTDEANKLIDQARANMAQAESLKSKAASNYEKLFADDARAEFPNNREQLKPDAELAADAFTKSAEMWRAAGENFRQATAMRVDQLMKDYWGLKVKQTDKVAEQLDLVAAQTRLFLDPSITDSDTLNTKAAEIDEKINALSKDVEALVAEANAIVKNNPTAFKVETADRD